MTFRRILVVITILLFSTVAMADKELVYSNVGGCRVVTLCNGNEAGDGDCEFTSGGPIAVFTPPADRLNVTISASASVASAFTCKLFGSTVGHDAAQGVTEITTEDVTPAARIFSVTGPPVTYWAQCLAVTGTVTLTGHFCPSN